MCIRDRVWDSLEDELEGEKERLPEIKKTFLEGYAEEYAYTQETESVSYTHLAAAIIFRS